MPDDFDFSFEKAIPQIQPFCQKHLASLPILNIDDYIVRVDDVFPNTPAVLTQEDKRLFSLGDISLITGESKAKKTFLASLLMAAFLSSHPLYGFHTNLIGRVLHIDTEQGKQRTQKIVRRVYRMLSWDFEYPKDSFISLSLRELSTHIRFALLEEAIKTFSPSFVVIDGFADMIVNTNDLTESAEKVSDLMRIAEEYNTHICSVVHTNPNSDKTRGHVGSELQRKCETVILVKKDGDISTVFPQFCRNQEFEKFSFFINQDGLPELCDSLPSLGERNKQLFTDIFIQQPTLSYSDLKKEIETREKCTSRTAERKIKDAIDFHILSKDTEKNYFLCKQITTDTPTPSIPPDGMSVNENLPF